MAMRIQEPAGFLRSKLTTPPLVHTDHTNDGSTRFSTSPSFLSSASHHRSESLTEIIQSFDNLPISDSYENPAPSLDVSEEADCFPLYSFPFCERPRYSRMTSPSPQLLTTQGSTPDLRLQTASCDLRRRLTRGFQVQDLESTLKEAQDEVVRKSQQVRELTKRVNALEDLLQRDRASLAALHEENLLLKDRIKRSEKVLAERVGAEVQRLSGLLSRSSQRLNAIKSSCVRTPLFTNANELCERLLKENRQLVAEKNSEKQWFQRELNSCLSGLAVQLMSLSRSLDQLSQVFTCIRKGEPVPVTMLLQHSAAQLPSEGLAATCKQEMDKIQTAVGAIRRVAADFYAEQCGQICNTQ